MVAAIILIPALVRWLILRNRDTLTSGPAKTETPAAVEA